MPSSIDLELKGYRLTTAEILYHLPDYPTVLQSFVLQKYDLAPRFPVIQGFLDYWEREIEARIHSVRLANVDLVGAGDLHYADGRFTLH
ncbi:MAG: Usg family protein [Rhodospirillales bacterium]